MHPTLRTLRTLATAAAVTVLAATLAAPANAGEDTSMVGAPAVGDCFDMTLKQAYEPSYSGSPVACTDDHTAVVDVVAKLPSRLDWSASDKAIGKVVAAACNDQFARTVGGTQLQRYRSSYASFVFFPTKAQKQDGARWLYCTISVREDSRLADMPRNLVKVDATPPNSIALCVTSKYEFTTCADTHAWRSSYAFYARGKAVDKVANDAANRTCPRHVTSRKWLRSYKDIEGPRFMLGCYSQTRR